MVAAVRVLDEGDFTPMAAVAGTFAELIAEAVLAAGADRVIVNNGGDIAARAAPGERVRVGIVSDLASRRVTHNLDLADGRAGGVATSGFGGRSLTKGIASAAVAVAASASVADALATALANATYAAHPAIERCLAEELDPGTDIRGHVVTRGRRSGGSAATALAAGRRRKELRRQGSAAGRASWETQAAWLARGLWPIRSLAVTGSLCRRIRDGTCVKATTRTGGGLARGEGC